METQTVNLPIVVPFYGYCWEYGVARVCQYFSNEGGHNACALNLGTQKDTIAGVAKADKCNALSRNMVDKMTDRDKFFWAIGQHNDSLANVVRDLTNMGVSQESIDKNLESYYDLAAETLLEAARRVTT